MLLCFTAPVRKILDTFAPGKKRGIVSSDSLLTAGTWGWLNNRWNDMGVGSASAIYRANMFTHSALAEFVLKDRH